MNDILVLHIITLPGRQIPASSNRFGMSAIDLGKATSLGSSDTESKGRETKHRLLGIST